MALASSIIDQALKLAGNTSIAAADALFWLKNFLDAEYRRKYPWQRLFATVPFTAGAVSNTANWPATFLDLFENQDGSCGTWVDTGGNIIKTWALNPREYQALIDRNTATGPPRRIVADDVAVTWYVYPKTDKAYTVTIPYYQLPAAVALGSTPLWSTWAPDAILVQAVKVAALEYQDDARYQGEYDALHGNRQRGIIGMLPAYRRTLMSREGTKKQSALDGRTFLPMGVGDAAYAGDTWP